VTQRSFLPGVRHECYRGSRAGSAIIGAGTALHGALGTWSKRVGRYIALTEFFAGKLAISRVPRLRIRIKPNFASDRGVGSGGGDFALFVGRLSQEKGLQTIFAADAAGLLPLPVHIVGSGPMQDAVKQACARPGSRLEYLGHKSSEEILALMKSSLVLLVPSVWYEEALSTGLPVIASRIGSLPEIVEDGVSGLLHEPGNMAELAACVINLRDNPERTSVMRSAARRRYLERYTEETNYSLLTAIYEELLEQGSDPHDHASSLDS
jgi:glycosyltransferase involved in cell wall biosynthesis